MADAKSIIEIEIKDQQYQQFIDSFTAYNEILVGQGDTWKHINEQAANAAHPMDKISDDTKAILASLEGMTSQIGKFNKVGSQTEKTTKETKKHFLEILGASKETTALMIKWGSIGLGAAGAAATGFAIMKGIAGSENDLRKDTKTLGISAGELQSQKANFDKFIDIESYLHNISQVRGDISKRGSLITAGMGGMENLNNADFAAQSLVKARNTFIKYGSTVQGADASGLTAMGFSFDTLTNLKNHTEAEIQASIAKEKADRNSVDQTDKQLKSWQDLNIQIDLFTKQLKTITADVLLPLASFINHPAESIANTGNALVDAIAMKPEKKPEKNWVNRVDDWLDSSAGRDDHKSPGNKISALKNLERQYKLPSDSLYGVWGAESFFGKNKGNSSAGAAGDFQFIPSTAKEYGISNRMDFNQSSSGAAHKLSDLLKEYKNDLRKALAGYNWGQKGLNADIKAHGADWERYAPKETRDYINRVVANMNKQQPATVNVNNQTGGNAVVTMSQVVY